MILSWRPLLIDDAAAVVSIAAVVHDAFPERPEALMSRVEVSPDTCFGLEGDGRLVGYVLAHPARFGAPPKLDCVIFPTPNADTLYIHDLALLPDARGGGSGQAITRHLKTLAQDAGLATLSLVAVHGSSGFWSRQGFEAYPIPPSTLESYGPQAMFMGCAIARN